jgi:hypothetical protein
MQVSTECTPQPPWQFRSRLEDAACLGGEVPLARLPIPQSDLLLLILQVGKQDSLAQTIETAAASGEEFVNGKN